MQTAKVTPIFEIGDIVRVPFPDVDIERREVRPALVVSRPLGPDDSLLWALMITSAKNRGWRGDVFVGEGHRTMGLPVASVVRCEKISVIEAVHAERVGSLPEDILAIAMQRMRQYLWQED